MTSGLSHLLGSSLPLVEAYDVGLLDLDGVVFLGNSPIHRSVVAIPKIRERGMRLAFLTNNSSRPIDGIVSLLRRMGVEVERQDVITAAHAVAGFLTTKLPRKADVLVVGGEGLREAVRSRGFGVVRAAPQEPPAVTVGFAPEVTWADIAEATIAVQRGALWVVPNYDLTYPSERGPVPGTGAIVRIIELVTQSQPVVVGKPEPQLFEECLVRTHARHPLMIGDRLDTDIAGANRAGLHSALVLTGVTKPVDLLSAPRTERPTFVAEDLSDLLVPHSAPDRPSSSVWACGGWQVVHHDDGVLLQGHGRDLDALRALCAAVWHSESVRRHLRPQNSDAVETCRRLGLLPE